MSAFKRSDDRPDGSSRQHLLTVVLEDYYQVAPLTSVVKADRWYRFESRLEKNTLSTLDLLDEFNAKATFFVLGWIADEMPELVREVARRGHEVASKGYHHRSIAQFEREEFRADVRRSREALERACDMAVRGYRIARGWFGPEDLWALDILAEEGFSYDSSLRSIYRRFSREPWRRTTHVHHRGPHKIQEFPLPSLSLGGWSFPIAGGNYFRQLPHWLMRRAVSSWIGRHESEFLMYFHVWELDPDQPRVQAVPYLERVRQYRNLEKMPAIIRHYLRQYRFTSIADFLNLAEDPARTERQLDALPERAEVPLSRHPSRYLEPSFRSKQHVSVVVPCLNEEAVLPYLANTLTSVERVLAADFELEYIFVDDGSSDGTWDKLQDIAGSRSNCRAVRHDSNRGVAAAILTGLRHAKSEVACSIDCDCTYDPHQLRSMIPMLGDGIDMVTGSPYHPDGRARNVPRWRLFLSRRLSSFYRMTLGETLHTYTSCFRVYRRDAVIKLDIKEGGFLGVAEMLGLLVLSGGTVVEFPAELEVRLLGRSKMKTLTTIVGHVKLLLRLARLRWAVRPGRGAPARSLDSVPLEPGAPSTIDHRIERDRGIQ